MKQRDELRGKKGDGQGLKAGGGGLSTEREKAGAMGASHRLSCASHQLCLELQLIPSGLHMVSPSKGSEGLKETLVLLSQQMKVILQLFSRRSPEQMCLCGRACCLHSGLEGLEGRGTEPWSEPGCAGIQGDLPARAIPPSSCHGHKRGGAKGISCKVVAMNPLSRVPGISVCSAHATPGPHKE